jgi:hypothetical protein
LGPAPLQTPATRASWAVFLVCVLAVSLAGLWWVTAGTWKLFEPMGLGNLFDGQAQSFASGRVDLDCNIASGEAFIVDRKCYIYFGPVPAVMRIPIHAIAPGSFGRLSRVMVWSANLLLLLFLLLILGEAGHPPGSWAWSAFLLLTAFGTSIPYMWSWPNTYVEALTWATAFGAGAVYCLLRWARDESSAWLMAACGVGLLAFYSRVTAGAGPLAFVGVIALRDWWRGGARRRPAAVVLAALAAFAGVFIAYNYVRFGTYIDALPMRYHVQYNASRLENIGGTLFHPMQAPPIFYNYLVHLPRFRASYPWLEYQPGAATDLGSLDLFELHTGVLPMMPALALLAWAGWRSLRGSRQRWMLLAPLPGLVMLASVAAVSHRYTHEFVLMFAPAAAFGLSWAWSTKRRLAITVALALFGIYANWAIAMLGQREIHPWTSDIALDRYRATRFRVDRWLGLTPPVSMPIDYDYKNGIPPPPVKGVEVRFARTGSLYVFDGTRWQHRSGPPMHRYTVRVRGGDVPADPKFNFFVAGEAPGAEMIVFRTAGPSRYRACVEHWGSPDYSCGREFTLESGREYEFVCDLDRLNRRVQVSLDGVVLATYQIEFHKWDEGVYSAIPGALVR